MSQNKKVSILMPVYNTEESLKNFTIASLLNQTYKNIEIICVDDGSTDGSLQVLEEFAKMDNRVKVFSQKNSGPAAARNLALSKATGDYIMFCDSDDSYINNTCETMVNTLEKQNADCVMCNAMRLTKTGCEIYDDYMSVYKMGRNYINEIYRGTEYIACLWNKIFKKSIIDKYKIDFPLGHKSDDNLFNYKYFSTIDYIYMIPDCLYMYMERDNSIMDLFRKKKNWEDLEDKTFLILDTYSFLKKNNLLEKNQVFFEYITKTELVVVYSTTPYIWIDKLFEEFKRLFEICKVKFNDNFLQVLSRLVTENNKKKTISVLENFYKYSELVNFDFHKTSYIEDYIQPEENTVHIAILKSSTSNYVAATILSIMDNADSKKNYKIYIIHINLSMAEQQIIKQLCKDKKNISIMFINAISAFYLYLNTLDSKSIELSLTYSIKLAFIFYGKFFKNLENVICLKENTIINTDIAKILELKDINNYPVSAVQEAYISQVSNIKPGPIVGLKDYFEKACNIKHLEKFADNSIFVMNIKLAKPILENFLKNYNSELIEKQSILYEDVNIFNSIFNDNINIIQDKTWNIQYYTDAELNYVDRQAYYMEYEEDDVKVFSYNPTRNIKYTRFANLFNKYMENNVLKIFTQFSLNNKNEKKYKFSSLFSD